MMLHHISEEENPTLPNKKMKPQVMPAAMTIMCISSKDNSIAPQGL
jgi:hypothetical protein